jgi:hypothetical protein
MLVQRLPDELRPSGRALFATIGALLTGSAAHESGVCGLLENARRAPVPETEFEAVGRWLARENGT